MTWVVLVPSLVAAAPAAELCEARVRLKRLSTLGTCVLELDPVLVGVGSVGFVPSPTFFRSMPSLRKMPDALQVLSLGFGVRVNSDGAVFVRSMLCS